MDLVQMDMNLFLGNRYDVYYPLHIPSSMVTFMHLIQLIEVKNYKQAFNCTTLLNEVLPEFIM